MNIIQLALGKRGWRDIHIKANAKKTMPKNPMISKSIDFN